MEDAGGAGECLEGVGVGRGVVGVGWEFGGVGGEDIVDGGVGGLVGVYGRVGGMGHGISLVAWLLSCDDGLLREER